VHQVENDIGLGLKPCVAVKPAVLINVGVSEKQLPVPRRMSGAPPTTRHADGIANRRPNNSIEALMPWNFKPLD
jgi:hypothetical protein